MRSLKKFMFVCTGNICRSAIAEALMKKKIVENHLEDKIMVCSCGLFAYNGDYPTQDAIEVMQEEYGIDLSKHRATNIQNSDVLRMDVILGMTLSHKLGILSLYPQLKEKVYTLKEYVNYQDSINIEIPDPYGCGIRAYRDSAKVIDECIDLLQKKEGIL